MESTNNKRITVLRPLSPKEHWLQNLIELPEHRFKALRRSRLKKQKKLEAKDKRGQLASQKELNIAYNEMTEMMLAQQERDKLKK